MSPDQYLSNSNTKTDSNNVPPINNQKGTSPDALFSNPKISELLTKGRAGLRGYGDSFFLQNLTSEANPYAVMAANQGFWSEFGNGLSQLASSTGLGSIESLGYTPGISQLINKISGSDQEFGNVLSDWARKTNEKFQKEVVPVYNNPETKDVSEWMFENIGSLGTTVGLLLPVLGELKLAGATAKAIGGLNLLKRGLAATSGIQEGSAAFSQVLSGLDTITAATLSRHMEGMMEGKEQYDKVYQESLGKGFTEEYAKKAANEAAQNTYTKNWPLVAVDALQFGVAFKSFKNLSRVANDLERKAIQRSLATKIGGATFQPGSEAFEEGYQYIIGAEASRNAKIKYGIDKEDYSTFPERFKDYLAGQHSDEFWTSAFFGALGGGVFEGITGLANRADDKKAQAIQSEIKTLLQQQSAVYEKDPIKFAKVSNDVLYQQIINALEHGRIQDIENMIKTVKESNPQGLTEDEAQELKDKADFALSQINDLSSYYDSIAGKNTPDITRYMMFNKANFNNLAIANQAYSLNFTKQINNLSQENGFSADLQKAFEAQSQLDILNELQKIPELKIDQSIYDIKKSQLEDQLKQYKDIAKTNDPSLNVDEKLNRVNRTILTGKDAVNKVLTELHLSQNSLDAYNVSTQSGKEKLQKEIDEQKQKNQDNAFKTLVDKITPASNGAEIQALREQAKVIGKEKEFNNAYNTKIASSKLEASKIDTNNIANSLKDRWKDNNLLKEHEVNNISQMILKSGGLPDNTILDEQTISSFYNTNPTFKKKFDDYIKQSNAGTPTTKKSISQQPISGSTIDTNKVAKDEKDQAKEIQTPRNNHHAWLSQGYQFVYDPTTRSFDTSKPNSNNLTDKIDWKYLNSGSIPIGAELRYELDNDDPFNKGKGAYDALIEIVHYDEKGGRHVIGALTGYSDSRTYESNEDKIKLKNLRDQLWDTAHPTNKSVPFRLSGISQIGTTKLKKYLSSNPWNTTQYNSPLDTLRPDEELVLGVVMPVNGIPTLVMNGHILTDKVPAFSTNMTTGEVRGTIGSVYMVIQNPATQEYYKYKLLTKQLKTQESLLDYVEVEIRKLEDNSETKDNILENINDIVFIRDVKYNGGKYIISYGSNEEPVTKEFTGDTLRQALGDLILQVDANKINKDYNGASYNKQLAQQGYISSDLNPNEHFHSTNIAIEPYNDSKIVKGELTITGSPLPSPNLTKVNEGKPQAIKDVGITKIELSSSNLSRFNIGKNTYRTDEVPNSDEISYYKNDNEISEAEYQLAHQQALGDKYIPRYSVSSDEKEFSPLNKLEARRWQNKNLPQVPLYIFDNLIYNIGNTAVKAAGRFDGAIIELYKGATNRTVYHENFHVVFNLILTPTEREVILNEIANEKPNQELNNKPENVYPTLNLRLEEILADRFSEYVENDQNEEGLGYNVKKFFKDLWALIKSLVTGNINIDLLFKRIQTGQYAKSTISPFKTYEVNYSIANANPYVQNRRVAMLNYQFFKALEELRNEYSLGDLTDLQLLKKINSNPKDSLQIVYGRVYNGLIEKYNENPSNQLKDVIDNLFTVEEGNVNGTGAYYGLAIQDLANYGIKIKENGIDLQEEVDEEQEEKFDFNEEEYKLADWQQKSQFRNPKSTLSNEVRKALRQLEKYKYNREQDDFNQNGLEDDLGFQSFVNYDEITNYLQKNIANIFDVDDMINQLEELKYHRPEIFGLINKLNENDRLKTRFFSDFSKVYLPYYMIQQYSTINPYDVDENGNPLQEIRFRLFNANRKSISQLIVDDWNNNLISTFRNEITNKDGSINIESATKYFNEYQELITQYRKFKEISDELANKFTNNLIKFGITIDPQIFINEYNTRKVYENGKRVEYTPYQNLLNFLSGGQSINVILSRLTKGDNPYQGDTSEASSIRKVTGTIARTRENLHQDTIINADGNQLYSYTSPTFLHKKIEELKTEKGRALYNENWWFQNNKWLQELNDPNNVELRNNLEVIILNSLKLENKDAVAYSDMTPRELAITDINLYNDKKEYAIYRTPIITGSSLAPAIIFKRYNKADVIDAFYQLALAEQQRIQNLANLAINIKNLTTNGKEFQFVDVFNDNSSVLENEGQAKQVIEKWLDQHKQEEQDRLFNEEVLTLNGTFNNTVDAAKYTPNFKDYSNKFEEYFYNVTLAKAMILQLTSVDISYYKNPNDFQKRAGQIMKPTRMINPQASYNGTLAGETYKTIYLIDETLEDGSEITDSETYITVDRRRKIAIGLGEWNDINERVYEQHLKGKAQDDSGAFSPLKPFYYNHETIGGWIIPVQHKNSEVTLTKNFTNNNPKLDKLRSYMVKNKIDSAIFVSAVKAGEYGAVKVEDLGKEIPHTLQNKYWGIQTEIPNHYLNQDILFGTQIKKLITADIPEDAKFFNNTMNKKEVFDTYQKLLTENIIESYNEIASEFNDINKIQKILLEEIDNRNLGPSYRKALEIKTDINGNKVFNIPLFDPIFGRRMQNILNAIIRNNVTRQRINGGSFVLASNFGVVKPKTSDKLKIIRNKDGGIEYMEVLLPAWMKNEFPRLPSGEVDFAAIKEEAPDLLKGFGFFIPTEGPNSSMALNVVGFLPDLEGGIAIFPGELIAISGKDFDKDEVYIMLPNHEVKDGKLSKIRYDKNKLITTETTIDIDLLKNTISKDISSKKINTKVIDPTTQESRLEESVASEAIFDIKDQYKKLEELIACLNK